MSVLDILNLKYFVIESIKYICKLKKNKNKIKIKIR